MATLTGQAIKDTYKDLLQVSNSNSGIDATLRNVSDGEATTAPLQLSSAAVNITSGFQLNGTAAQSGALLKHEVGGIEADISAIADGGMLVGTGTGTMAIRASALTAGAAGFLKHEVGGIEFDASAVVDGDVIVGTGAGTMGLESGATLRTTLGLGTGNTPVFTAVNFGGSDLDTYIGATAWTPTIAGDGTAGSAVYVTQVGRYVQIGALVFITGRIDLSSFSGAVGNTIIGGLPKTVLNVTGLFGAMASGYSGINLTTNYTQFNLLVQGNTKTMYFRQYGDNQADATVDVGAVSGTAEIFFSGCYLTAE